MKITPALLASILTEYPGLNRPKSDVNCSR